MFSMKYANAPAKNAVKRVPAIDITDDIASTGFALEKLVWNPPVKTIRSKAKLVNWSIAARSVNSNQFPISKPINIKPTNVGNPTLLVVLHDQALITKIIPNISITSILTTS